MYNILRVSAYLYVLRLNAHTTIITFIHFTCPYYIIGILQEENPVVTIPANDVSATLRCHLYGYLPPGVPSISWFLDLSDDMLTNDATYTIANEVGDRLIQNGESQTRPSVLSVLSINLINSPVSSIQSYFCQSNQVPPPGVRQIMLSKFTINIIFIPHFKDDV